MIAQSGIKEVIYHKPGETNQNTDKGKIYLASKNILQAALPERYKYINYSIIIAYPCNFYRINSLEEKIKVKKLVLHLKEVKESVLQCERDQRIISNRGLLFFFCIGFVIYILIM